MTYMATQKKTRIPTLGVMKFTLLVEHFFTYHDYHFVC